MKIPWLAYHDFCQALFRCPFPGLSPDPSSSDVSFCPSVVVALKLMSRISTSLSFKSISSLFRLWPLGWTFLISYKIGLRHYERAHGIILQMSTKSYYLQDDWFWNRLIILYMPLILPTLTLQEYPLSCQNFLKFVKAYDQVRDKALYI